MITISQFFRKPLPLGHFSIESYFDTISQLAPADIKIKKIEAPFYSKGLWNRIRIGWHARQNQNKVNHITGDIHFIAPFLNWNKTILTIHDCGQLKIKSGLAYHILKFFWFTLPCKLVKIITVNSEYTKQDLLTYVPIPPEKIKVIPIFVSATYKKSPKEFNKIKPRILQIGTAHNKNIERTILALKDIHCHLTILGRLSPDQLNLLKTNEIEHTYIEKPLTETELFTLYQESDILSLCSTLEGFGMPIVEANQIGIAVITSNCTSMPWVAGNAAHLVDPLDVKDMNQGFKKIIENVEYRYKLIDNGYKNAMRFDSAYIADEYYREYKKIAA